MTSRHRSIAARLSPRVAGWARRLELRLVLLPLAASLSAVSPVEGLDFGVIVHPSNPTRTISQAQLEAFFLKKTTAWSHGVAVVPVDQPVSSSARASFSEAVMGRTVDEVQAYWRAQIFAGESTSPVVLGSDAEVAAHVAANPGAIGYVSSGASAGGCKTVSISESDSGPNPGAGDDPSEIAAVLALYESAYESKSLDDVRAIWPTLTSAWARKIASGFSVVREWTVDLEVVELNIERDEAQVRCRRKVNMISVDGQSVENVSESVFQMRRSDGGWRIFNVT